MKVNIQNIYKWFFSPVSVGVLTVITIASSPSLSFGAATTNISSPTTSRKLVAQNEGNYRNNTFKLRFNYSTKDFVLDHKTTRPSSNLNLLVIDLWNKKHAQKIKAGAYEGGAEYPANAQVRVYYNPRRLSLQNWVKQSQDFAAPKKFSNVKIAGQNALQFESSGLYENKHTVLINPKNSNIIVISLSQIGSGNDDAIYRKGYQQVLQSLRFN
ncbi:hypothetical protein [Anabaena sp. PCC 7108]|uniref:hypothetical protein n=1 Tax=Anabaena sp. PCC 7108 TaxID=163908 RepID=UPI000345C908|nr:hypothetical protein [Anabaena sp. PCC 7108]